jgi:hypothetical protein
MASLDEALVDAGGNGTLRYTIQRTLVNGARSRAYDL